MEGWGYVWRGRFVKIVRKIDGAMSGVLVALLVLGYNTMQVMEDSPHTREEIMKMVLEIRNKVNVKRLEEEDFKDFWDDIDID